LTTENATESAEANAPTETQAAADETPPQAAPPTKKRAASPTPRAQEPRSMSDETKPAPPSIPTEIVQQLAQLEALRAENAKFKAAEEARLKTDEETKTALAKLQEQIQLTERDKAKLAEENRSTKIANAVRLAAMAAGAVDPDDVTMLLSGKFTLDESGNVIAADETKAKATDAVKAFLEKKPHLAGRKVAGGSGASPFPAQSAPNAPSYDMSNPADVNRAFHDRLRAVASPAPTGK
jgi:hypothetical protein